MDNTSTTPHARLPDHGRISCRRCFEDSAPVAEKGRWRYVNDPCAWGASTPSVIVLGFSKGFTQANAAQGRRFDDIPFKGMRVRLTEVLQTVGVLEPGEKVDGRIVASERNVAFGSLVRCSLSRRDDRTGKYACTGAIMPKAFTEVAPILARCAETFLAPLPESVRLVLMLGTGDAYISGCRDLIASIHPKTFKIVNAVAYQAGNATWVHVSHPSGMNGYHPAWMAGLADKQGRKRQLAVAATNACLNRAGCVP